MRLSFHWWFIGSEGEVRCKRRYPHPHKCESILLKVQKQKNASWSKSCWKDLNVKGFPYLISYIERQIKISRDTQDLISDSILDINEFLMPRTKARKFQWLKRNRIYRKEDSKELHYRSDSMQNLMKEMEIKHGKTFSCWNVFH